MSQVLLGEVEVPSGVLLILDPGLARFWCGSGKPQSPRPDDPKYVDLQIVGPDAIEAGTNYARQFDPRYLFDVSDVPRATEQFSKFVSEHGFNASVTPMSEQMTHVERAMQAVELDLGPAVVPYSQLWSVVISGLPTDRKLPVYATPIEEGQFSGRWRSIDLVIDENARVARSESVEGVMVDYGQLICADLVAFQEFRMWESLDGLGDFLFWGQDAEELATELGIGLITDREFGWRDVALEELKTHADRVQSLVDERKLQIGIDFRPHCNLEKLNAQIRESDNEAGTVELEGSLACGFVNRWGDGIFPIICDYDGADKLVRVRIDVGNESRQTLMRAVILRQLGAYVTRRIWDETLPVQFADRDAPHSPQDSGWLFSSGTEDEAYMADASNIVICKVQSMLDRCPELEPIIDSDVGSQFRRDGSEFVSG